MPRRKKDSEDEDEEEYEVGTKKSKKERKSKKEKKSKKSKKSKKKQEDSSEEGQISDEDLFGENEDSNATTSVSVPLKKRKNIQPDPQPANDSDDEFHDGYDEDLMGDDEDRKYLMGLTEKQREEILLERYNRRKELQARWEMKKRLKATSGASSSSSSSTSATSSTATSTSPRRVPKRNKTTDTTKASAFSDLKKKRAKAYYDDDDFDDEDQFESQDERDSDEDFVVGESSEKKTRSSSGKRGNKGETVSITVGPDSGNNNKEEGGGWGDSDNDEDNLEKPAKLENITEICLTRDYLEKNLDNIHFDDFVRDFFVRIGIGKNNDKLVYRLAQIVGVKEGPKKYYVGKKSTSKLITLQHGSATKSFSIEHVSNKPPTSSEFSRWYSESEKHNITIPTRKQVKEKLDVKEALNNYIYTEDDIKLIVAKNKQNKMPVNVAAERLSLITLREAAQDINNTEEVERLSVKIQELDKIALAQKKALENERVIAINEKNKLTNQTQKYDSSANAAVSENDPFSRRHTKPSFPIFIKNQQEENNNNASVVISKDSETSSKPEVKKEEMKKKEVDPSSLLKSAHDFELDLSNVSDDTTSSKSSAPINTNVVQNKRPTLSVNDYKVRRGLI